MAQRPVFVPGNPDLGLVQEAQVQFEWFPGFAASQKQKSIRSLHDAAATTIGAGPYLEISSKSLEHLGTQLSAFRLLVEGFSEHPIPVENAFQGSKVFASGGPYRDLYHVSPLDAKRDPRIRAPEPVVSFSPPGSVWPNTPTTAFYDWVYIKALTDVPEVLQRIDRYTGFTDIEFNPAKSLNCQARSCALAVALRRHDLLAIAMEDRDAFIDVCYRNEARPQEGLFD
jgi:hypothetical protein